MIQSGIRDGHPWTIDESHLVSELLPNDREILMKWIKSKFKASKTPYNATSYGIKHHFEADSHIYLTNNQMKDALCECGFKPVDAKTLNWSFFIADKTILDKDAESGERFKRWLAGKYMKSDGSFKNNRFGDLAEIVVSDDFASDNLVDLYDHFENKGRTVSFLDALITSYTHFVRDASR